MDRGLHGAGHGQRHDGEDEGYVVLLVVSGHASMALATDASTVTTYTPESVTSHYVGW